MQYIPSVLSQHALLYAWTCMCIHNRPLSNHLSVCSHFSLEPNVPLCKGARILDHPSEPAMLLPNLSIINVLLRHEKEGRSKQGQINKAKQHIQGCTYTCIHIHMSHNEISSTCNRKHTHACGGAHAVTNMLTAYARAPTEHGTLISIPHQCVQHNRGRQKAWLLPFG